MNHQKMEKEGVKGATAKESYQSTQLRQHTHSEPIFFQGTRALEKASIFQKISFTWVFPIWRISYRSEKLTHEMLGTLHKDFQSSNQIRKLERVWDQYKERKGGLCKAILRAYSCNLLLTCLFIFVEIMIQMLSPLMLYFVMRFLQDTYDNDYLRGSIFMGALLLSQYMSFMFSQHVLLYYDLLAIKARIVLIGLITQKSLKSSPSATKIFSHGEIVNRLGTDSQNLKRFFCCLGTAIKNLNAIFLGLIGFYKILGLSSLSGLVPLTIFIFVSAILVKKIINIQAQIMKAKDIRVGITTQAIQNIKTIKLAGREAHFQRKVLQAREEELKLFKQFQILELINHVMVLPAALIATMLGVYLLLGHSASPSIVFPILLIFEIMRGDLYQIPKIITAFVQASVSMNRIEGYLKIEEVDSKFIQKQLLDPFQYALQIQNGSFRWSNRKLKEGEDN